LLRRLFFNLWYFRRPPWDSGITPPELLEFLQSHPPGRVLDMGCGTGTNLVTLAKEGWQVMGVDFAWRAVTKARQRLKQAGCMGEVLTGDVTKVKIEGVFDLVLDIGCYHGLPVQTRLEYQRRLLPWLVEGGNLLMYAHQVDQPDSLGITEAEINGLGKLLKLVKRVDSQDPWGRKATWLTFCRL
jgi:cyclopropane fatty-acyl-phospholipid synthase-like methyltransferase